MANTCINYERILLPLDLSSYSEATFTHALSLALAYKAELLIINVINSRGLDALDQLAAEGYAVSRDKYVESVKTDRLAQFQK
jgi:nucleotide-binding universal stress UspA family protein